MSYIENVCGWHERENVSIGKFDGQNDMSLGQGRKIVSG